MMGPHNRTRARHGPRIPRRSHLPVNPKRDPGGSRLCVLSRVYSAGGVCTRQNTQPALQPTRRKLLDTSLPERVCFLPKLAERKAVLPISWRLFSVRVRIEDNRGAIVVDLAGLAWAIWQSKRETPEMGRVEAAVEQAAAA